PRLLLVFPPAVLHAAADPPPAPRLGRPPRRRSRESEDDRPLLGHDRGRRAPARARLAALAAGHHPEPLRRPLARSGAAAPRRQPPAADRPRGAARPPRPRPLRPPPRGARGRGRPRLLPRLVPAALDRAPRLHRARQPAAPRRGAAPRRRFQAAALLAPGRGLTRLRLGADLVALRHPELQPAR